MNASVFDHTGQSSSVFGGAGTNPPQFIFAVPTTNTTSAFGNTSTNPQNTSASPFGIVPRDTVTSVFGGTQTSTTTPAPDQPSNSTPSTFSNLQPTLAFRQPSVVGSRRSQLGSITLRALCPPSMLVAFSTPSQSATAGAPSTMPTNDPLDPLFVSTIGVPQFSSVFGQPTQMNSLFGPQHSTRHSFSITNLDSSIISVDPLLFTLVTLCGVILV